jgi:hypothetical protein
MKKTKNRFELIDEDFGSIGTLKLDQFRAPDQTYLDVLWSYLYTNEIPVKSLQVRTVKSYTSKWETIANLKPGDSTTVYGMTFVNKATAQTPD